MTDETKQTEKTEQINWLEEEILQNQVPSDYEKLPSLKLLPNKLTEIEVDFNKQFEKWTDSETKTTKAIIPVKLAGVRHNFWLNTKNPLYHQLLEKGKMGIVKFKVLQTGTQKDTRYNIVD